MSVECPINHLRCKSVRRVVRFGQFYRTSDRRWVQRYRCTQCGKHFSQATQSDCFNQKKRHLNHEIFEYLVSGVSQRRICRLLKIKQITVARKLSFLGLKARHWNLNNRLKHSKILEVQFDDLETFEHTKLKPLSVTLAVEKSSRFIVGFEVSRMPAKGLLAKKALKKYGPRKDERPEARQRFFRRVGNSFAPGALIESDENPHYKEVIRSFFPESKHQTTKGQRGCIVGQGELKKTKFDPLFSLNHTCAMLRANINRLFRKTWCTTKKLQPLIDHIELYVMYHNRVLIE